MSRTRTRWEGQQAFKRNLERYGENAKAAVVSLLERWKIDIEAYAKQHATWKDQTGNARQNLFTWIDDGKVLRLYLSHGVEYGLWLEIAHAGRYAVIMPTLQAHEARLMQSVRALFA